MADKPSKPTESPKPQKPPAPQIQPDPALANYVQRGDKSPKETK